MVNNMMHLARLTAFALSLVAVGAMAQDASVTSTPQDFKWATPAARDALIQKGSDYFAGAAGNFVNPESMRASGVRMQRNDAQASSNPHAPPDLSSQFSYVFGGVPGPQTTLQGGQQLFTACEVHDCLGRRAFLVTDSTGETVQSAGFLNIECPVGADFQKSGRTLPASCDNVPTLTIFYSDRQAKQPALSIEIIKWARNQVIQDKQANRLKVREQFLR